jgi:hypothetical protein
LTTPTTQRIPLSHIKEMLGHLETRSWFAEATRRERLEAAVLCARNERLDALRWPVLTEEELRELEKPAAVLESEGEKLPW